jgi:hypothetical protein
MSSTRREALRAGLALAAGVAAAPLHPAVAGAQERPTDAGVIAAAVAFEERSALAYRTALGTGLLRGATRAEVAHIGGHEAVHAAALRTALEALGTPRPAPPRPDARLAGAGSREEVLEHLLSLESASVATYQRALQTLQGPRLIETAASIMAVEAQHLALIRQALGRESVFEPFVRG